MDNRDIIVIGGSSGATAPLKQILGGLPRDLPAAVFVVLHIPARSIGILATVTQAASHMAVFPAEDGMEIRLGHIYLGVPDRHLLGADGRIRLGRGPRENMARPAIDPLFHSAAVSYGPRVVGVLLSGLLNDGAAGLSAIKRCGGLALVQDPQDAIADEMPLAGLRAVSADLVTHPQRSPHRAAQQLDRADPRFRCRGTGREFPNLARRGRGGRMRRSLLCTACQPAFGGTTFSLHRDRCPSRRWAA